MAADRVSLLAIGAIQLEVRDAKSMQSVAIVYATDRAYLTLTEFSIASLALFSTSHLDINLFVTPDTRSVDEKLVRFLKARGHTFNQQFLDPGSGALERVALHPHISPVTLMKAQAIERAAAQNPRIVFLDGDVLACQAADFTSAFRFETTIAAVYDFVSYMNYDGQELIGHTERCGVSSDYFNAGVMFVDGRRWAAEGAFSRFLKNAEGHSDRCPYRHDASGNDPGDCKGADQCAFNMTFEKDWTPLDFRWNVQKPLRHMALWQCAILRHYTGFRKFLASSSVNRDSVERKVLARIVQEAGLRLPQPLQSDGGLMFLVDRLKYHRDKEQYVAVVRKLCARASQWDILIT